MEYEGEDIDDPLLISDDFVKAGNALGGKVGDDFKKLADDWKNNKDVLNDLDQIFDDFRKEGKNDLADDFLNVEAAYEDDLGNALEKAGEDLENYNE